jgi:hypothetical protein
VVPYQASHSKESEHTEAKEERGKHTDIRLDALLRRMAALNKSGGRGGLTTHARVKEATKVSEMCG